METKIIILNNPGERGQIIINWWNNWNGFTKLSWQNLRNVAKAVFSGKCIALKTFTTVKTEVEWSGCSTKKRINNVQC